MLGQPNNMLDKIIQWLTLWFNNSGLPNYDSRIYYVLYFKWIFDFKSVEILADHELQQLSQHNEPMVFSNLNPIDVYISVHEGSNVW